MLNYLLQGLILIFSMTFVILAMGTGIHYYQQWTYKRSQAKKLAAMPLLYTCDNNGVMALVRATDYDVAVQEYWAKIGQGEAKHPGGMAIMYVVPNTMIFASDSHPFKEVVRRRVGDHFYRQKLQEGCRIESRLFFVPFSTYVYDIEWQRQQYSFISAVTAWNLVHGAR